MWVFRCEMNGRKLEQKICGLVEAATEMLARVAAEVRMLLFLFFFYLADEQRRLEKIRPSLTTPRWMTPIKGQREDARGGEWWDGAPRRITLRLDAEKCSKGQFIP